MVKVGTDKNEMLNRTTSVDMIFGQNTANTINGNAIDDTATDFNDDEDDTQDGSIPKF
jgi:hypothetical protein